MLHRSLTCSQRGSNPTSALVTQFAIQPSSNLAYCISLVVNLCISRVCLFCLLIKVFTLYNPNKLHSTPPTPTNPQAKKKDRNRIIPSQQLKHFPRLTPTHQKIPLLLHLPLPTPDKNTFRFFFPLHNSLHNSQHIPIQPCRGKVRHRRTYPSFFRIPVLTRT